ncbi:MAG: DUF58 domain-containing protein [Fimbriiglobus sp.]
MLPLDLMRQIRRLQFRARREVRTLFGGGYRSAFKGTGLSFEEVREYQPGDDVRSIDWNVTARMGQPFIKRYAEERELTILICADLSASRNFGTQATTKRTVMAEMAAVIAFAAVMHNDRVGFLGFTSELERHIRPGKGSTHALRVLRDLLYFEPQHKATDLAANLENLNRQYRRRAIVFFFSDFLDEGYEELFRRTASRHDLIAVRLEDERETSWPDSGLIRLEDLETGEQILIDTHDRKFRAAYDQAAKARSDDFRQLAREAHVDVIRAKTDGTHFDSLLEFFRSREARQRGGR